MLATLLCACAALGQPQATEMPWGVVAEDKKSFVLEATGKHFIPWGFNYDHDTEGRLIEDYWDKEWDKVEAHFGQMKKLGANVVRIHLQVGKFMDAADRPNEKALDRLTKLVALAEKERLYLDLTGLGCYHNHHGDLCHHDGRIFVAVNLGKFNEPKGKADSWVYVYDAKDLAFVDKHEVQQVVHGAGGMAYHDGRFFVVGGLPKGDEENYVTSTTGTSSSSKRTSSKAATRCWAFRRPRLPTATSGSAATAASCSRPIPL